MATPLSISGGTQLHRPPAGHSPGLLELLDRREVGFGLAEAPRGRPKMSDFSLDDSSLIGALKAQIARTVSELDAIIAKLEDMKHDLTDPLIEAQRLAAKRFKDDAHLRQLSEKSETTKKALDNLMLQTVEQEQYHGQILASVEVLRNFSCLQRKHCRQPRSATSIAFSVSTSLGSEEERLAGEGWNAGHRTSARAHHRRLSGRCA